MSTRTPIEELERSRRTPVEIELPASTAWPIVLAFGFTLMFAGLLTSASISVLGVALAVAGCVGWFREVFPYEHEETVPVVFEAMPRRNEAPHCRACASRTQPRAGMAPCEDVPGVGWLEGWLGRRSGDGCSGLCLRARQSRKHLVSHQPPCRYCLCTIASARPRSTEFISCG